MLWEVIFTLPKHLQKDLLSKIKASFTSTQRHEEGTSSQNMSAPKKHILKDIDNPIDQCLTTDPLATLFDTLKIKEEPADAVRMLPSFTFPIYILFIQRVLLMSLLIPFFQNFVHVLVQIQIPQKPTIPRDERTLFVTFSNGYPFTADELYEFFEG